ncbi:MAG: GTPase Era [Deltaproteobacteria bacterium]|nr:MAG: GTPase Era [Deltaproteobacteria bacterium]
MSDDAASKGEGKVHRAGVVAILGRPNAGKSTLLNELLGEKLAIVTAKPQTTRSRLLGILTLDDAQLLLLDTPGMHSGGKALNLALNDLVDQAAADCDVAVLLVDLKTGWGDDYAELLKTLLKRRTPVLLVGNKADLPGAVNAAWPPAGVDAAHEILQISARTGEGVGRLLATLVKILPEAPALYPEDQISDRPMRFLAAELVREAAMEELSQEIPYSLAVDVVEYKEDRPGLTRIRADLLVERATQKQIVIGTGGAVIKKIGIRARREIEKRVEQKVHLDLWVKVEPKWSKRPKRLKSLGYS